MLPIVLDYIWLMILAFGAGTATSLVGFGSGIMISPILVFFGFAPTQIASGSIFATFGNLSGATITHVIKKKIKYSLGLKFGLLAVPGSIVGAILDQYVDPEIFSIMLSCVLAFSAFMLLRGKTSSSGGLSSRYMTATIVPISIIGGIISSFFGIGGGVVIVPFMVLGMGMKMKEVAVVSQPALLVIAFTGVLMHTYLGHTEIFLALLLLASAFVGGLLGVRLSKRLGDKQMRIVLSALIFSAAAKLLWVTIEDAYYGILSILSILQCKL